MKPRKMLAAAAALALAAQAGAQPGPAADEALAPYASMENAVRLPDGRLLNFVCMGEGSPTVILTPGMGDFSGSGWAPVHAEMAKTTKVCAWDRPGFGMSDGSAVPQTVATTAADLEAALATGQIPGPYVLVGHSLGAYESLLFADRNPERTAGMVLVDPSSPGQHEVMTRLMPALAAQPTESGPAAVFRTCAAQIRSGELRADGPDPNNCVNFPPFFPKVLRDALRAKVLGNPLQYESQFSFATAFADHSRLAVNPARNYGDLPLIVLAAGTAPPPPPPNLPPEQLGALNAINESRNKALDDLAELSTRGVVTPVEGANHYIQRSRPQAVIDAVNSVVAQARSAAGGV